MRFIRSINIKVARAALGLAVVSAGIIIISLLIGVEATLWLPLLVGLWLGFFLVWGVFRFLGWGRSAAKFIYFGGRSSGCS